MLVIEDKHSGGSYRKGGIYRLPDGLKPVTYRKVYEKKAALPLQALLSFLRFQSFLQNVL
jgi:hypothetical protein